MKLNDNPFRPTPEIPHYPMKREGSLVESVKAHIRFKSRVYGVDREDSEYPASFKTSKLKRRRRLDPLDRPRMRIDNMQPSWSSESCVLTPSGSNPHESVFGYSFRAINSKPAPATNILRVTSDHSKTFPKRRHLPPLHSGSIHAVAEVNCSFEPLDDTPRTDDDVTVTSEATSHRPRKKKKCLCDDCGNSERLKRR